MLSGGLFACTTTTQVPVEPEQKPQIEQPVVDDSSKTDATEGDKVTEPTEKPEEVKPTEPEAKPKPEEKPAAKPTKGSSKMGSFSNDGNRLPGSLATKSFIPFSISLENSFSDRFSLTCTPLMSILLEL